MLFSKMKPSEVADNSMFHTWDMLQPRCLIKSTSELIMHISSCLGGKKQHKQIREILKK